MWIVFDILVIAIIALCTFIGYKRGLVKSAVSILAFFIAIIVAFALYKPVSKLIINNTSIDDNIKSAITEKIKPENPDENEEVGTKEYIELKIFEGVENTVDAVSEAFAVKLIEIVTFLLIYIIVKIALRFITALADLIAKLPLLKQINEVGGIIYGLIKGIVIVFTILAVMYLIEPLLSNNIKQNIDKSLITKTLYNNNIILNLIV